MFSSLTRVCKRCPAVLLRFSSRSLSFSLDDYFTALPVSSNLQHAFPHPNSSRRTWSPNSVRKLEPRRDLLLAFRPCVKIHLCLCPYVLPSLWSPIELQPLHVCSGPPHSLLPQGHASVIVLSHSSVIQLFLCTGSLLSAYTHAVMSPNLKSNQTLSWLYIIVILSHLSASLHSITPCKGCQGHPLWFLFFHFFLNLFS